MRYAILIVLVFAPFSIAQGPAGSNTGNSAVGKTSEGPEIRLASAAVTAHGGEKLRQMRSLVINGSVDVTTSASAQAIPGTFTMVIAGDRYLFEIQTPFQTLRQSFDGVSTRSSMQGFALPPLTAIGFPLLTKVGKSGYAISGLSGNRKKGFRVTTPEGYYTDFLINEKSGAVTGFESSYEIRGRTVTTSAEIDKFRTIEGIIIPDRYAQRFDLGSLTAYASFKSREILVNTEIPDSIFGEPK